MRSLKASIEFSYIRILLSTFRNSYGEQFSMEEGKVGAKERYVGLDATSFSNSFEIARSWDLRSLAKLTKQSKLGMRREYGGNVPIAKMYEMRHLPQQLVRGHILKYIYKILLRGKIKFYHDKVIFQFLF